MNNNYNLNINKLNELYNKYPERTNKELSKLILRLQSYEESNSFSKIINNKKYTNLILIIIFIMIALLGLLNLSIGEFAGMYYFGLIFFIAGYFVNMAKVPATIIFLFSHGIAGLGIMTIPIISHIMNNPILTDNPISVYIYLGICLTIILIATIFAIIYNLSLFRDEREYYKWIPAALYLVGIFMITILPHILPYIYNITLR